MTSRVRSAAARGITLCALLALCLAPASMAGAEADLVEVFTEDLTVPAPLDPATELALQQAEARAEANPTDLAPPYVNPSTGRVTAPTTTTASSDRVAYAAATVSVTPESAVTDDGGDTPDESVGVTEGKTEEDAERTPTAAATRPTIPRVFYPATPKVKYSLADLDAVLDEILTVDVADGVLMQTGYIDAEHNRVVVTVPWIDDTLRASLAARYGTDKVAIELTPSAPDPALLSRDYDTTPFYGGSKAQICTNAFAWTHEGVRYLVTAGHCTTANGPWYMPGGRLVGKVARDNWNNTTGSTKLAGQSYYSGDVSTVQLTNGYSSAPQMFVGGRTSNSSRKVAGVPSRYTKRGDKICSGGAITGQLCGWWVQRTGVTVEYIDGQILRNGIRAYRNGTCMKNGDSGGPVYTVRNDGKVVARGIISGGSGNYGGGQNPCTGLFTDIKLAEKAFPGIVRTG